MILYPAIDMKDGRCVRLLRGDMNRETVFHDDPSEPARAFAEAGCDWLHLVDLNGAVEGRPVNAAAVDSILAAVSIPVQLGGGVRSRETLETWLDKGVRRIILGTAAVRDPDFVREACAAHPGRIAVGVDARMGKVAVQGWAETTELDTLELVKRFEDAGVAAVIYTDIERDGALRGPNVDATAALSRSTRIPVIASGGVSSMADIVALKTCGAPLDGVVVGRALYDGRIDANEASRYLKEVI